MNIAVGAATVHSPYVDPYVSNKLSSECTIFQADILMVMKAAANIVLTKKSNSMLGS